MLTELLDKLLHLDVTLQEIIAAYGVWTYAILGTVIFCETGLVVLPFLPGDSLLFAAGAFAATGALDPALLVVILSAAAILGNIVNYSVGYRIGPAAARNIRFLNKEHLDRTHRFYERYGGTTIVIARFIPIIRTFAPFVAGLGFMSYGRFMLYNVAAGIGWVAIFIFGGYYFGNLPAVRSNFTLVIAAIIVISTLPAVVALLKQRLSRSTGS